ncbi:hypothetical protein C8J56DRAFT_719726, partial [Mycena floridula]
AKWIAKRSRPYAIIKDPELLEMFKMLYAKVDVVSPQTVSRDIIEMHAISKETVTAQLKDYIGKLHIGVDGWASAN